MISPERLAELKLRVAEVVRQCPVPIREVRVFGSVARGTDTPTSDVDLLVRLDDTFMPSLFDQYDLDAAFAAGLQQPVDVLIDVRHFRSQPNNPHERFVNKVLPISFIVHHG